MRSFSLRLQPLQKPEMQLRLTQSLIQSIELLSLTLNDLEETIYQKVQENPFLEIVTYRQRARGGSQNVNLCESIPYQPSLYEHLITQAREVFNEEQLPIVEEIAGNLNEKGFLAIEMDEIARVCNVTESDVGGVLKEFVLLEPVGIGAKSAREALLIQARRKRFALGAFLLEEYYDQLLHGQYDKIAKEINGTISEVREIVEEEIKPLNPFPGNGFHISVTKVQVPEFSINKIGGRWVVRPIDKDFPELMVRDMALSENQVWEKRLYQEANDFIEALHRRKKFIADVTLAVADLQKEYLTGDSDCLKPLLLSDLASSMGISISTLSRVVSDKSIETPRGVVRLRSLFTSALSKGGDQDTSKQRAKLLLKQMIEAENRKKPLGDEALASLMKEQHQIHLSRRTITKYRKEMGILASSYRSCSRF